MEIKMSERYFKVKQDPDSWVDARGKRNSVVTMTPWQHTILSLGGIAVKGRKSWNAPTPIWKNEVIYYNVVDFPLIATLKNIVVHHTNNSQSVLETERKQQARGYAALGYHLFIDEKGFVYEGRPLEIMGSHAGVGKTSGPLSDPDWGAIGIVLQGDYHHADDWIFNSTAPKKQLDMLEKLVLAIKNKYPINQLLMHREIDRSGKPTVCPGDHLVPYIESLRKKLKMRGK